jgi:hypothetical protein
MIELFLPALLLLAPQAPAVAPQPSVAEIKPLSFFSQSYAFKWDQQLKLTGEVDGLKVNSIFFNKRAFTIGFLKGADFGTRAEIEVTNLANVSRNPGFAVAVFDAENRLLGAATGGSKLGRVAPGATETFELNFHQVLERMPKGDHFYLSIELAP